MDDYLPPIVTRLKGDWSDLRAAFLESRAMAKAWAVGVKDDIVSGLRNAGHLGGLAFADALKSTVGKEMMDGFDEDVGTKMREQARKMGEGAGGSAARSFASTFSGIGTPLIIAAVVALTPLIATAVGAAITTAFGLGIVGLGVFLVREQPAVLAAAQALKNTLKAVFTDAALPFVPALVEAMKRLQEMAVEFGPHFKEIFTAIAPVIPNIADGIGAFIRELLPGLKAATPLMGDMVAAFVGMGEFVGHGLSEFLMKMVEVGPELWQFMVDVGVVLGDLLPMIGSFVALMAQVHGFFEHGAGKGLGLLGPLESMAALWPEIEKGAKAAWAWIKKVGDTIGTWVGDKADKVSAWWNGMIETVRTKGGEVADWFQGLPDRIGAWMAALPGRLRDAAVAGFDAFFFALGFGATRLFMFFDTLPERLSMWAVRTWETIKTRFTQGVDNAQLTMQMWADRLPILLDSLFNRIAEWGRKTWENMVNRAQQMVTDVQRWWDSLPGRVSSAADRVLTTVKNWASGAASWLFNAGKSMVQGLVNGAIDATDGAIAAIKRAIQRIIDGAKRALGIASPSKVFAEMGKFSMLGFVEGLQGERGTLSRAWAGLAPTSPVVGAAPSAPGRPPGDDDRPILVQLILDGDVIDEKLVTRAQRRKERTGVTGYA